MSRGVNQHFNSFFNVSVYHAYSFCHSEFFMTRKCSMVVFWGVKFWSRVFFIMFEALGIFWVWLLPPSDHPCHLKSRVPPWAFSPFHKFLLIAKGIDFFNSLKFCKISKTVAANVHTCRYGILEKMDSGTAQLVGRYL